MTDTTGDEFFVGLFDEFLEARRSALQLARWASCDPPIDTCRYCGRYWRCVANSRLDGHAACIVGIDFKRHVGELLRSPLVTYKNVAEVIGVTPAVVRSWSFSAGVTGPVSHRLRKLTDP